MFRLAMMLASAVLLAPLATGSGAYKCVVKTASGLTQEGRLDKTDALKIYVGSEFVLDRETGRMSGKLSNHAATGRPKVIDPGSSEQAYKALTVFEPFTQINLIHVEEFREGTTKPFMFIDANMVFTGTCVHF